MARQFLIFQCNQHFRKNENISDKIPQYPADLRPQGIYTFGVASSFENKGPVRKLTGRGQSLRQLLINLR